MGENEQGGMLRTVVVIGLVAIIAIVITVGVVGLKNNMTKNTDSAVGAVATAKIPYGVVNPDVTYKKYGVVDPDVTYKKYTPRNSSAYWGDHGDHGNYFPVVGDIPDNSWREDRLVLNSSERIYIRVNINNYIGTWTPTSSDDNDDGSKRLLEVYDENGNKISSTNSLYDKVYLDKDKDYTLVVKYFNNSGHTLRELSGAGNSVLVSGTDDGSPYRLTIKSFEAATYDDKYTK